MNKSPELTQERRDEMDKEKQVEVLTINEEIVRLQKLEELCGEMIATLTIPANEALLPPALVDPIITRWRRTYDEHKAKK